MTIRKVLHRRRLRLKDRDYSLDGAYYVTLVVQDRNRCFGELINSEKKLNEYGKIVTRQFEWMQQQYQYVEIPVWVVMPEHIHALIEIRKGQVATDPDQSSSTDSHPTDKIKPLPELIGALKTTSSKKIHEAGLAGFRWQRSYHEHIIRDNVDYSRIYNYIANNPLGKAGRDRPQSTNKEKI